MGNHKRTLSSDEIKQRRVMRRSIVSQNNIKKGSMIKRSDLNFKRPGIGIPPKDISSLIGKSYDSDWDHFINLKKPA